MSYKTGQFDDRILLLLKNGGVGVMPSDTIYGISCRALDVKAVERTQKLKGRGNDKPFVVLVADIGQLEELGITDIERELVKELWPGPVSVIFEAPKAPAWLSRDRTLAVRLPGNNALRALINQTGPIISTSANLDGQKPAESIEQARKIFANRVDFYVDTGDLPGKPSTIVKIENGKLEVVRQGVYKLKN